MWQNNRKILIAAGLAFSLLLTVPSAQAQDDILEVIPNTTPAETYEVALSTVSIPDSAMLEICYPQEQIVTFENSAVFQECLVTVGAEVKAGDVLARFTKEKDELAFTRLELALNKAEQSMLEGILQRQDTISQAREALASITDAYEKELAELNLEYLETELEQYRFHQQKTVDRHQAALDEANAALTDLELIAPIDGYIGEITKCSKGDSVYAGSYSVTIQQRDVQLFTISTNAASSQLRYNMPVTIRSQQKTLTGRVVYASDAIPLVSQSDAIYIELDPEYSDLQLRSASMTCDLIGLGNVALIPREYLRGDQNGNKYVFVTKDGKTQRHYVYCFYEDSEYALIPFGLENGDILSMY